MAISFLLENLSVIAKTGIQISMRVWLQMQHVPTSSLESDGMVHSDSIRSDMMSGHILFVNVIEISASGWVSRQRLRIDELVRYFAAPQAGHSKSKNTVPCYRDLMTFLRPNKSSASSKDQSGQEVPIHPSILPRPSLGFFMIDMLQLKIICWEDRCLVLDADQSDSSNGALKVNNNSARPQTASSALLVEVFTRNLSHSLQSADRGLKGCAFDLSWHRDVIRECAMSYIPHNQMGTPEVVPFEMLVIDNALHTVIGKFNRHLTMIRPIFNVLLEETVASPSDKILRRILAFKKSLMSFETNVLFIEEAINSFLANDKDMSSLYLSEKRDVTEHEEVELLLEGYRLDLQEIEVANQTMLAQIDETKEFINTQLNEARNRIIRMSLNIEMCMLGLTFGACFASVFGMNLRSGLEDHPFAFYLTVSSIIFFSSIIIALLIWRCVSIMNLSHQPHHPILKNFFKYVDIVEFLNINKGRNDMTKASLDEQLMRMINKDVSPEDVDLIFLIFDDTNRGVLSKNEFHEIMKRLTPGARK